MRDVKTYADLPYRFRQWAGERGMDELAALTLWKHHATGLVMEFVEAQLLDGYRAAPAPEGKSWVDDCLRRIRGEGVHFS